jgi:hypothetical protein
VINDNDDVRVEVLDKRNVQGYGNLKAFIDVEFHHSGRSLTLYNLKVTEKSGDTYIGLPKDVMEAILNKI